VNLGSSCAASVNAFSEASNLPDHNKTSASVSFGFGSFGSSSTCFFAAAIAGSHSR
jgi:hypothetical protein